MSSEENRSVHSETEIKGEHVVTSRRSFAKAGILATPAIMTLSSKTALGAVYQCTASGTHSGNTSNLVENVSCPVGISPTDWRNNVFSLDTNLNGNLNDWLGAGVVPFSISGPSPKKVTYFNASNASVTESGGSLVNGGAKAMEIYDAINNQSLGTAATTFNDKFNGSVDDRTIQQILMAGSPSDLNYQAVVAYLNAALFQNTGKLPTMSQVYTGLTPEYIVAVYSNPDISDDTKHNFFTMIHM